MDFLAKHREYVFLNNKNTKVRIHTTKVLSSDYEIWTESDSKKFRDAIGLIEMTLSSFNQDDLCPIVIVSQRKVGKGAISAYDHDKDVIFYNCEYCTVDKINKYLSGNSYVAQNLNGILKHELGHRKHWQAIKKFYRNNETRYNNINEAKNELDSKILKHIEEQGSGFGIQLYLRQIVSIYAENSFKLAKFQVSTNIINEVIAEFCVKERTQDPELDRLIKEVIDYGKA